MIHICLRAIQSSLLSRATPIIPKQISIKRQLQSPGLKVRELERFAMRRSSRVSKGNKGFTLAELLIAGSVTAMVLVSICGIYFLISSEWEHQQGQANALMATSQACSRLDEKISQATSATLMTRFVSNDTLLINLPSDKSGDIYVPYWSTTKLQYRSGLWKVFYTSDTTGSYSRQGDILWMGGVTWPGGTYTVTPDSTWSMYYNSKRGRTTPIKSLRFTLESPSIYDRVTIMVVSAYKLGATEEQLSQNRTVCLRNSD